MTDCLADCSIVSAAVDKSEVVERSSVEILYSSWLVQVESWAQYRILLSNQLNYREIGVPPRVTRRAEALE